jgi:hypothetical protein
MMKTILTHTFKTLALGLFVALALSSAAHAQATRTWVSGVGDDANPCSRTAPCKTFAGAISKTAAGGEIDALDPGGFGGLTITKSITIDGGGGQIASALVSGTPGFTINAGNSDMVTLRNLQINGTGTGTTGINLINGSQLIVDHCTISGFTQAVSLYPSGLASASLGLVSLKNVTIQNCASGLLVTAGAADLSHSSLTQITNIAAEASGSSGSTIALLSCTLTGNGTAVQSDSGTVVRLSDNDIFNNGTGISILAGGKVASAGNNRKAGNVTPGAPNAAIAVQ